MRCYKCGQTIEDTATFCRFCGTSQGSGETTVLDQASNPFMAAPVSLDEETQYSAPVVETKPEPKVENEYRPVDTWKDYEPAYNSVPSYQNPTPAYQNPVPAYQPAAVPAYQPNAVPAYQNPYEPQPYAPVYTDHGAGNRPVNQLPTNRGLLKMIFLPLVTFGIYAYVIWSRIVTELNIVASRYDGKRTMPFSDMAMLMAPTFGIHYLVWIHRFCNRIGDELRRRGIDYKFGAGTFWGWNVLGSLIIVGPFIYMHKLMKSMNLLNADYNERG